MFSWSKELQFALSAVRKAGDIAFAMQKEKLKTATKIDGTVVTEADLAVEEFLIKEIQNYFPKDEILGEETALSSNENLVPIAKRKYRRNRRRWIIDPIDGTASFVRNTPFWATLLALEVDKEITVGVVYAPTSGDLFYAARGFGAYKNGQRIFASPCQELSQAQFNFGELNLVELTAAAEGFFPLVRATQRQRGYGDYLGPTMVFEGKAEIMLEPMGKPWDFAVMKILAQESGAVFRDLSNSDSIYAGGSFIAASGVADQAYEIIMNRSSQSSARKR